MAVRFPNPPLDRIRAEDLLTKAQAAEHFGVDPNVIDTWIKRGKVEHVPLPGRGPRMYHLVPLARAERDAWEHGADRPVRGGRRPGWTPASNAIAAAA